MKAENRIQYTRNPDIDRIKWDQCIHKSGNSLIYAHSFYLDRMAAHWDALVLDDYRAVMPLPWKSKFGIRYLYQPFLTAQLGIFGDYSPEINTGNFIAAIPAVFKLAELPLNYGNWHDLSDTRIRSRENLILELNNPYEDLVTRYSENTRRNIKKAYQAGCSVIEEPGAEAVIGLALDRMKKQDRNIRENVKRFRSLYKDLEEKNQTRTLGIQKEGRLLSSGVFFVSGKRAYYILVGNHPDSRVAGASHALIDAFIRANAGTDLVLDFEGSDIPGLASFYQGFGAQSQPYPFLQINRLPFYLRWLK
ncbi:MAG: GNAT family N-acetyltransferase [Chitinophagaceae bacterium]